MLSQSTKAGKEPGAAAPRTEVERQAAMALLARASTAELRQGLEYAHCNLTCEDLRAPEIGLVMARGRIS